MEKLKIPYTIIVEGKYDKIKISSIADACIITTEGFGVFKSSEKLALIQKLAERSKIILLTDSDGAGKVIRSHITSAIPRDRLIQLYIPQVKGKERRKDHASKEGYLGVEGIDAQRLYDLLSPFAIQSGEESVPREEITKADMFACGLTGGEESAEKRDELSLKLDLPSKMTPNALLSALNVLLTREEFFELVNSRKI